MKKGVFVLLFVITLGLVGVNNTIDLKAQNKEDIARSNVQTEVIDVIELDQLGFEGSNIYATRGISEEGVENLYCYKVSSNGSNYNLLSNYTVIRGTSDRPYLVIYQDYYLLDGEKYIIDGDGYLNSSKYGSVRCELYLLKGGEGGHELAEWY